MSLYKSSRSCETSETTPLSSADIVHSLHREATQLWGTRWAIGHFNCFLSFRFGHHPCVDVLSVSSLCLFRPSWLAERRQTLLWHSQKSQCGLFLSQWWMEGFILSLCLETLFFMIHKEVPHGDWTCSCVCSCIWGDITCLTHCQVEQYHGRRLK